MAPVPSAWPVDMDSAAPLSRRGRVTVVVAAVAVPLLALGLWTIGPSTWPMLPALVSAQYVAMAAVCAFTAFLLFGVARSSGQRGYLVLAGTFLYVAGLNAVSPLFVSGGIFTQGEPAPVWGGPQSAVHVYSLWHWVFAFGIIAGAAILEADRARGRRAELGRRGIAVAVSSVALAVIACVGVVALASDALPTMFVGTTLTPLTRMLSETRLLVTGAGAVYVGILVWRRGALINRWIFAVMLVMVAESIVVLRPERNMVTYYANLALALVAASVLLFVLAWTLAWVGRKQAEVAATDAGTGVRTRTRLLQHLAEELQRSSRTRAHVALLWLDLDGFQQVNDQFGHEAGDEVLREVARRLDDLMGPGDAVGRLGGDEFGVVLCDTSGPVNDVVDEMGDRILRVIRDPISVTDAKVIVTASIGVAVAATPATEASDLMLQADVSMFAAKNAGGDTVEKFTEAMGSRAVRRATLRHDLSAALREEAFSLDFQPIVDGHDLSWRGAEVLVRWDRGQERVAAAHFAEFAERTGQIVAIGRLVQDMIGRDAPRILAAGGPDFFLTMNMSVKELATTSLVDGVLTGPLAALAPRLFVEVTESFELHADAKAVSNLARLQDGGFGVAIDDFGSGYSNLTELTLLHPRFIKADRSLLEAATSGSKEGVALLAAAKAIAESLGCDVIAEGVEFSVDDAVARAMDVRYLQGYLYARPMPLADLITGLEASTTTHEGAASGGSAAIVVARFMPDGTLRTGSPRFLQITGAREGVNLVDLVSEGQRPSMRRMLDSGVLPDRRRYLNFACGDRVPVPLLVEWARDTDDLVLVGEPAEGERDETQLALVRLNSRVAEVARDSAKKSAEFERALKDALPPDDPADAPASEAGGDHD